MFSGFLMLSKHAMSVGKKGNHPRYGNEYVIREKIREMSVILFDWLEFGQLTSPMPGRIKKKFLNVSFARCAFDCLLLVLLIALYTERE